MTTFTESKVSPPRERGGGIVGPLLLVSAGIVLLLNNLGVVSWDIWSLFFRLWPIFLVAAGLDLLIGRRSLAGSLFVAAATVIMLAAGVWFTSSNVFGAAASSEVIGRSIDGASEAVVDIGAGVGLLRVGTSIDEGQLVQGDIDLGRGERIAEQYEVQGDTVTYHLRSESTGSNFFPFWNNDSREWTLNLSPEVPMDLTLKTGVGQSILDLEELTVTRLEVKTGVGETILTLPASGEYEADVKGGVGELTIRVPEELAIRIDVSTGLGDTEVRGEYERDGDSYLSPNYASAENRVELEVKGGIGEITIEPIR